MDYLKSSMFDRFIVNASRILYSAIHIHVRTYCTGSQSLLCITFRSVEVKMMFIMVTKYQYSWLVHLINANQITKAKDGTYR